MSKKLIAGAGVVASLAVALAPLATFAADATYNDYNSDVHTDYLRITVLPTCSFGSAAGELDIAGVAHNADGSDATWTTTTGTQAQVATEGAANTVADDKTGMTPDAASQTEHRSAHLGTYSIYAGTKNDAFATTTLTVVCNRTTGYKIAFTANALSDGNSHTIPAGAYSASTSGYNIVGVADVDSVDATLPAANATSGAVVVNQASTAAGDDFTFTYGIGVAPSQVTGTYQGTVEYDLIQQLTIGD